MIPCKWEDHRFSKNPDTGQSDCEICGYSELHLFRVKVDNLIECQKSLMDACETYRKTLEARGRRLNELEAENGRLRGRSRVFAHIIRRSRGVILRWHDKFRPWDELIPGGMMRRMESEEGVEDG